MKIINLSYYNYKKLFKHIKKVLESDAKMLNEEEFKTIWAKDSKFRKQWNAFIFFKEVDCPDCAARLGIVFNPNQGKKNNIGLKLLKHRS